MSDDSTLASSSHAEGNSELTPVLVVSVPENCRLGNGKSKECLLPGDEPIAGVQINEQAPSADPQHRSFAYGTEMTPAIGAAEEANFHKCSCGAEQTPGDARQEKLTVLASLVSRYNRDRLYEEVWKYPMRTVAGMYQVSDVALANTCKKLHIPTPPQGYWNKVAAGKPVGPRPPLPTVQIEQRAVARHNWRRHTSEEASILLHQIVLAVSNGKTLTVACQEVGINDTTYRRWKERLTANDLSG
ncbi:MAG: helix-turn-helix domain-containing protein [Terracidiphilus sp.]